MDLEEQSDAYASDAQCFKRWHRKLAQVGSEPTIAEICASIRNLFKNNCYRFGSPQILIFMAFKLCGSIEIRKPLKLFFSFLVPRKLVFFWVLIY